MALTNNARAADGADQGWVKGANSRARLNWCGGPTASPGTTGLQPQSHELAFLEVQLDPGWKTYWRMPGDSGVAPNFDWSAASNLAKATVAYPAPHRIADQGGEVVGYKSGVVFPVRVERSTPAALTVLTLTAEFGICKNICVPVEFKLTGACFGTGQSSEIAAAVEAVPRAPDQRRDTDPRVAAVTGSVTAPSPRLTFDIDFGVGATDADLFVEAPEGLYVPLPVRATPDAQGRARFVIDLSKSIDAKDLLGKPLRLTMVSSKGAAEAVWVAK